MKEYGLLAIGTGSVMMVVDAWLGRHPDQRAAVVEKDEPGGICLTRGCIPSKILLYPAELVRDLERASLFGLELSPPRIHFDRVMERMRKLVGTDVEAIRRGLRSSPQLDYYPGVGEFVGPHTLRVGPETLHAPHILLGTGSAVRVPAIPGLKEVGYLTSDTVLGLRALPESLAVIGGGYIAAEYGHFFAAMGSQVTILGRNPRFLPREEPEIASVAGRSLGRHLSLRLDHEVLSVRPGARGKKVLRVRDRSRGSELELAVSEVLVAAGRGPQHGVLHPERTGVELDRQGWIRVNEYLETTQPGIWALGDGTGAAQFKHRANHDARILYENLVEGQHHPVDYHAVPHAVFTVPEVASVGLTEEEALRLLGQDRLLVGRYAFEATAKGEAMALEEGLVKVLVERGPLRILGAHIVGPQASVLLQEVVNLMYTPDQSAWPILRGMHIHPALSEVVERAFLALQPPGPTPGG